MWTQLKSMFEESNRRVKIHGGIYEQGIEDVAKINTSPESCIGAIITNTCGISVDNWICILGQSSNQHAGVTDFDSRAGLDFGDMLVVAIDIVGGVFALNMGRFENDQGLVCYWLWLFLDICFHFHKIFELFLIVYLLLLLCNILTNCYYCHLVSD